jgi:uroporphyrinogen III methyltransferase/synthase
MTQEKDEGFVSLVGAGPGDPGLITMKGRDRIREADVIVHDRLVNSRLLEDAGEEAELIYVGKTPDAGASAAGLDAHDQEAINRLLVEKAREGKRVVRLKGGDPFVFGRGGEEAQALRQAGIRFEVVPGVTSAVAAPAYAGIPVTHRGVASSFAVVTGHEDPSKEETAINWEHLATGVDTLVFLMGVRALPDIVAQLVAHGRSPDTPAAVIRWGATPEQRTVTGTLADIVERVREGGITPPAITVVGEVVRLRETLEWFEGRPLFGKRVLVTRTEDQADAFSQALEAEGAIPVELPAIEIEELVDVDEVLRVVSSLYDGKYDVVIFTSENAASIFFDTLWEHGFDARPIGGADVAAIGPRTAAALFLWGVRADIVPGNAVSEDLAGALEEGRELKGMRILLPRAEGGRQVLVQRLQARGARVEELILYRSVVPKEVPEETLAQLKDGKIDIVTFTSGSTVRNLVQMLGGDISPLKGALIACIGPATAKTAEELGLQVAVVAREHTVEGMLEALREHFAGAEAPHA